MSGHLSCFDIFLLVTVPIVVTANIILACCIGIVLPKHMKEMGWYYIGDLGEMSQETKMDFCSCAKGLHRESYPPSGGQTTSGTIKPIKPPDKSTTTRTTVSTASSEATKITTESTKAPLTTQEVQTSANGDRAMYPHSKTGKLITLSEATAITETTTVFYNTKMKLASPKVTTTSPKITTTSPKAPTTSEIYSTASSLDYSLSNKDSTRIDSSTVMQTISSSHGSTSRQDSTSGGSTPTLETRDTTVRMRPGKGFLAKIDV